MTGAGGSIGKELISQMLDYHPEQLLCLDQSEMAIFDLNFTVLNNSTDEGRISVKVLDITDEESLRHCFETFKPTLIFHAAAHKHGNLMEDQPDEALRNNYFASVQLMRLSKEFSVDRFILISTDKAINPTSVMGVTKRMAELAMQRFKRILKIKLSLWQFVLVMF